MDQARYATSVVANYIDTATIKENSKFHRTTLPHDMIFNKADANTSDEQVELLSREYNIHCRAFVGSLIRIFLQEWIYVLRYTIWKKNSSNDGKVHFEGLVHFLRYIRDNNNLGSKYYAKIEDVPLSDLLRQARINNDNQLIVFSDSIWQDCPDIVRSTGEYIVFYQGGPIDHCTHIPGPVAQYSAKSEYNAA